MQVNVFPKDEQHYLDPKEIVSRIATTVPTVLIDWARGDQQVETKLKKLIAQDAPEVIIMGHKAILSGPVIALRGVFGIGRKREGFVRAG